MNELALGPSQPPRPIPYGLVTLWDMINFNLHALLWAFALIRQEYGLASKEEKAAPPGERLSLADQARLRDNLRHGIAPPLMALYIAEDRLGTITRLVEHRGPYAEIAHELKALGSDLMSATQYERFYHYPRDKGSLVLRVPGDWAATIKAFPSAEEDIKAAVDCYALGHSHASIHHSMMVLEFGLPALATRLSVRFNPDKAAWAELTRGIRNKITAERDLLANRPKGVPAPSRVSAKKKSAFLDACEEAAIEFRYFTTVWRNHVAHGRADYDENDAKKVLEHVRTFMEVISTKLKLKERR